MGELTPRPVARTVDELVGGARRTAMDKHQDSLSGSGFERVVIDGRPFVIKYMGYEQDWLARALDDRDCWSRTLWQSGLLDRLPPTIDHTIVGMSFDESTGSAAALMHDVGPWLLPAGSDPIPIAVHERFMVHMARMHAGFWDFTDTVGLLDPGRRFEALTPATGARERRRGSTDEVPNALEVCWSAMRDADPVLHDLALALCTEPAPLVAAFAETPVTLVHGDWKIGNLGTHDDGRTILLDWGWPGRAAPLVDVAWYIAVNCDRLPTSKENAISSYRDALEAAGVATGGWFERQLPLALLGGFLQLGWSKPGDPVEFGWWRDRVMPVARELAG